MSLTTLVYSVSLYVVVDTATREVNSVRVDDESTRFEDRPMTSVEKIALEIAEVEDWPAWEVGL